VISEEELAHGPVIMLTQIPGGGWGAGWMLGGVWQGCVFHAPRPCGELGIDTAPCARRIASLGESVYGEVWIGGEWAGVLEEMLTGART